MHLSTAFGLAASIAGAQAVFQGFNYGATLSDGTTAMEYNDFKSRFSRAQNLEGTSGFTSARLYTMIQGGTTDDVSSAFQAAIDTKTSLLLGVWCSGGQEIVTNEINALKSAIQQLGDGFTSLVVGISVGSEDLYRVTPTGIQNDAGLGASPDELVSYIKQVRGAISGTSLSGASIGHVDTWTAWVNGSNSAVIEAVDWLGMDTYPYFQTTVQNSIDNGNQTFWQAYDVTQGAGSGKDVWITETGWPVSGKTSGQAVASVQNAETYWQEVGCALFGQYNTWWYTLEDSIPTTPNPSFGIIGNNLNSQPIYDLKCKKQPVKQSNSSSTKTAGGKTTEAGSHATGTGNHGTATGGSPAGASETGNVATSAGFTGATAPSASASATGGNATGGASQASSAIGAGILAIFALVATL
jgi:glucan endo-1,3-beta-D-glucosidase